MHYIAAAVAISPSPLSAMLSTLLLAIPAAMCVAASGNTDSRDVAHHASADAALPVTAASLEEVYRQGRSLSAFLLGVQRRRDVWDESIRLAAVPDALAVRARAVGGTWRVLIISEPGCSDSANSVPYIAKLAELTPGMEVRLVTSDLGRPWLEAHRTPDGRAATPAVLLLDESYSIRGCWVEQPAALQAWWLPALEDGTAPRRFDEKMRWYRRDSGREVLREFVEMLEAGGAGTGTCPGLRS
jgi:hypothetical protein